MASVTVKLFGVFRSDTHMAKETFAIDKVADIFPILNVKMNTVYSLNSANDPTLVQPEPIQFKDAIVYVNGEKATRRSVKLKDGDEVWIMSPASGG